MCFLQKLNLEELSEIPLFYCCLIVLEVSKVLFSDTTTEIEMFKLGSQTGTLEYELGSLPGTMFLTSVCSPSFAIKNFSLQVLGKSFTSC